ncbi:uracil phosphoribosyltransferase [Candidatus Dependentiae bacterium]|nr:uracil phosphoribosyltransferase [Candidatus Dependentiae bacterium]
MKQSLLTILRNKNTGLIEFRNATKKLALILAQETSNHLEKQEIEIITPEGKTKGVELKNDIVFIPILRAALSLLPAFLKFFEKAKVGFLGLKRDEKTTIPEIYYKNFPQISTSDDVIILDPMIATGGSGEKAIEILIKERIKEEKIIFVAVICSQEGLNRIKNKFSKIKIIYVQKDLELNKNKFIVPGLGDFGDRYFGTLNHK